MGQGFRRLRRRVLGMAIEPLETRALLSDLFGSYFDAPASAAPGSTIDVTYQVNHTGGPDTPSFQVNFYASANSTIGGTDTLLGGTDLTLTADSNTGHLTKSLTLPAANDPFWATVSGGSYYIGMLVDSGGSVTESDENNNGNTGDALDRDTVLVPPDLFGDFFDAAPASSLPGTTFNVSYQLRNGGTGPTAQFHTDFYLSSNATINTSDIKLGNGVDTTLGAAATTGHQPYSVTLPDRNDPFWSTVTTGTFYIGMITDTGDAVVEWNESNNSSRAVAQDLDSVVLPPIDLIGDFFDVPGAIASGATINATYQVRNSGAGLPAIFHVSFYLSSNSTITDTDTLLATGVDITLGANANTGHLTQSLTLPGGLSNGPFFIGMIIDSGKVVLETSETNNANVGDHLDRQAIVIDNTAPAAALATVTPPASGATASFIVTYTDNVLVKAGSIGSTDVRVTGPNGYSQLATLVGVVSQDANSIAVNYTIPAPDGAWDFSDNGTYTVSMVSSEVTDTANNPVAAGSLGSFGVNISATPPMIGSLSGTPNPVLRPNNLTLTANTVAAGAGTIDKVEFYRDMNQNGVLDVGIDSLLGTDIDATGGWSLATSSLGFSTVTNGNRFFARAQDSGGFWSNVVTTTGTASNQAPTIGTLTTSPSPTVTRGTDLTLTANNVVDADGSITKVEFYRDSNGNGILEIGTDVLLGSDTNSAGGWTFITSSTTLDLATPNRFFARATDNDAATSNIPQATVNAVNASPTIGSLTDSPDPVLRSESVTLTANGVADVDGTIVKVDFYRDSNGNGELDVLTDELLKSDTNATDGWSATGLAANFPVGAITYFARAQDNLGGFTIATATGVVEPLSISPNPVVRGQNITLTANGLSNANTKKVEFYRDSNNNNVLDVADDLLGADSDSAGGWTVTHSTAGFPTGANRYFSRATDNQDVLGTPAVITGTVNNVTPTIGSLTTNAPDPLKRGTILTLTANDVNDSDGTITKVEFYRDSNSNGVLDIGTDELLGPPDTDSTDGWKLVDASSLTFKIGVNKFFARATDNDNGVSNLATTTLTVSIANPTITSLTAAPDPVVRGQSITLTANGVSDPDGTIAKVQFYRDTNNNGTLEVGTDILLGTDSDSAGGWTFTGSSASFKLGENKFFARATDNDGGVSVVTLANTGKLVANNAIPTIETLSDSPDPVLRSQNLTLTANTVADPDGTITKVEFYRDGNGDGILNVGDILLGTDTSSAGGWTFTGSAAALPFGPIKYFARATDNDLATSVAVSSSGSVEPVSISLNPVIRGADITLTANGLDNATTTKVEFYRDSDNNGLLDLDTDTLLGSDIDSAGGWTLTTPTTGFPAGANRYFARVNTETSAWGSITGTVTNKVPTIGSFGINAPTVTRGTNVILTANTVADTDGTISKVEFYRDSNENGVLDPATDTLLGSGTEGAPGVWTLSASSATFKIGANKFFARATDNDGGVSATPNTTVTAANAAPVIATLSDTPDPIVRGQNITLTANTVTDADGTIAKVEFYRDVNNNGTLEVGTDILLGTDTNSTGGWTFTGSSVAFPVGDAIKFLARAQDNNGAFSALVSTTAKVTNATPAIVSLTANPTPLDRGKPITLTANNVTDADGPIKKVEFWRDANGNGVIDAGIDVQLGTDTSSTGGWTFTGATAVGSTEFFPTGVNHFLARAIDNLDQASALVATTATINDANPVIASLTAQPSLLQPGKTLTLTANGVVDDEPVTKVEFYRDVNNNGLLDLAGDNPDVLLGADTTLVDGWTWAFDTTGLSLGNYGFLARAQDSKNAWSNVVKVPVTIANPCSIIGKIFNDANGNGIKNLGDKPVSGWRVYIDENNNKRFDAGERSIRTDTKGRWTLNPAHFGTNRIRYVLAKGWKATTPATLTLKLNNASCLPAKLFGVKKIV